MIVADALMVAGLAGLGAWLETIGGKTDWMDRFLTPFPLSLTGLVIVGIERWFA